jgi:hypothetical protein
MYYKIIILRLGDKTKNEEIDNEKLSEKINNLYIFFSDNIDDITKHLNDDLAKLDKIIENVLKDENAGNMNIKIYFQLNETKQMLKEIQNKQNNIEESDIDAIKTKIADILEYLYYNI